MVGSKGAVCGTRSLRKAAAEIRIVILFQILNEHVPTINKTNNFAVLRRVVFGAVVVRRQQFTALF
jgi:hypothetical protein